MKTTFNLEAVCGGRLYITHDGDIYEIGIVDSTQDRRQTFICASEDIDALCTWLSDALDGDESST